MDEVEAINMDDLNELEARLYAQIHHESSEPGGCDTSGTYTVENPVPMPTVRTVTATRVVNRIGANKSGRYWNDAKSQHVSNNQRTKDTQQNQANKVEQQQLCPTATKASEESNSQDTSVTTKYSSIPKISNIAGISQKPSNKSQPEERTETPNAEDNSEGRTIEQAGGAEQQSSPFQAPKSQAPGSKISTPSTKHDGQIAEKTKGQPQLTNNKTNKNLRVNPAATWVAPKAKANKQNRSDRQNKELPPPPPNTQKNGPFAKQIQKLNKAMRLEAKKQKSKTVKSKKKQPKLLQTIVLESSEESDSDDVIVIPIPPPPTYTIDDSDEDKSSVNKIEENSTTTNILVLEENAQDANDVDLEKAAFAKPLSASNDSIDQSLSNQQNSSRCTSPCSVLSSDDFIGQTDRSRLLKDTGIADDEDLLMLTADVDSLMELPRKNTQDDPINSENRDIQMEKDSSDEVECTMFVPPTNASSTSKNNYRVDQTQFRALDVYESESDITDSIYTKGKPKETIIRAVGSSSDDDADQENTDIGQKTKRLRKRRASGSNKESETNNEGSSSSEADEWGIIDATAVPFIARGPAVENCITKTRNDSQSSSSQRANGQMSDNEFIATLNTLAQGGNDEEQANDDDDDNSHSDHEISARDIAEEVLTGGKVRHSRTTAGSVIERSISESEQITENSTSEYWNAAVPNDAIANLDKVFETIDSLDKRQNRNRGDVVDISDDSGEEEQNVEPPPAVGQQEPAPKSRKRQIRQGEVVDPVYNVIYSEKNRFSGGLGWNDEMRRFYNDSWKGENFNLKFIWNKMDPNRNLWKIYTEDRFPKSRRLMNLKCHNCCEFGHIRAKCTRPKKPLICYMCGQRGHYEPRCPNTICLRCGNKTHVFTKSCNACTFQNRLICPVCKVRGHTLNLCPDKWRRYHSTTKPNAYPNSNVEYKTKKCCCICGGRGHLSETCKSAVRFLEYPVFVSEIKSHQKSYNDQAIKTMETGIGYNLLYRPDVDVSFELAENTTSKDYYGRFLNAVGMGYLLKRKRKANALTTSSPKKAKSNNEKYVPNPYSKAGQEARNEPEQVQEITESGNVENITTEENFISIDEDEPNSVSDNEENIMSSDIPQTKEGEIEVEFKTPVIIEANTQVEPQREIEPIPLDSDSNYSFSEHFEHPSYASTTSDIQTKKSREMEPLPDFIPLNDVDTSTDSDVDHQAGISKKYVTANTDDEEDSRPKSPLPDVPCEAKIYLTHFHSKYLLSPEGHKFLVDTSKECNIKARLDWTSVGHVLIIFGLQENQDKFHRELLLKYRHLSDQMNRKRLESSQKVPRRADVLIRFLRENINQLMTNLGNVNDLFKRLKYLENHQQSKSEWKSAEKARKSLNMILFGQAGLSDGSFHLDKLLLSLKKLINEYKGDDNASNELRDEIDNHWKVIFTSYRHDNYPELVDMYNKLLTKNRIPKLNIDPILLGIKVIDTTLTKEQKERMETLNNPKNNITTEKRLQSSTKESQGKQMTVVPNPLNSKNNKPVQKPRSNSSQTAAKTNEGISPKSTASPPTTTKGNKDIQQSVSVNTSKLKNNNVQTPISKKPRLSPPPFANPQQKSNIAAKITEVSQKWETTCDSLLNEIEAPTPEKGPVRDCKAPSMFWSRECMKFLQDCIKVVKSNVVLAEKLQRVQTKAQSGSLSYNDYRAVIKLHKAILGK